MSAKRDSRSEQGFLKPIPSILGGTGNGSPAHCKEHCLTMGRWLRWPLARHTCKRVPYILASSFSHFSIRWKNSNCKCCREFLPTVVSPLPRSLEEDLHIQILMLACLRVMCFGSFLSAAPRLGLPAPWGVQGRNVRRDIRSRLCWLCVGPILGSCSLHPC